MAKRFFNALRNTVVVVAVLNLLSSIIFGLYVKNMAFEERIIAVIVINLGYFFFYFLIGKVPVAQLDWLQDKSSKNVFPLQLKMMLLFLRLIKIVAVVAFAYFVIASLVREEYFKIFASLMLWGIFLGADRSHTKIKQTISGQS